MPRSSTLRGGPSTSRLFSDVTPPPPTGRGGEPHPPVPDSNADLIAQELDDLRIAYGTDDDFDPGHYLSREPTPALLAAKAEPLGEAPAKRRPQRRSQLSSRPADGRLDSRSEATIRASRTRAQTKRKPKEPSKLLLALGMVGIVLIGVAAGYYFTRGGNQVDGDQVASPSTAPTTVAGLDATPATSDTTEVAAGPATGRTPDVVFDEAAGGPIQAGAPYTIGVAGGPSAANYRLLVDDVPQADPAPELAPVIFTPGRHLLVIEITSPQGNTNTNPVVVYALGEVPEPSWRANLASVNLTTEGWGEAVRRFDEFTAAGHSELELMPSDPYPSLAPGYWNIFVDGFTDRASALAYCAQFDLNVPDQCFAKRFDASAPAGG